ncbi:MAG: Eco57I restriction-modification methylase domain-containing protein [Opitutae bacterium]|nr:Eco57I restriction-modification methylase domain-containing protein [Opitutae bacterium]
MVDMAFREAHQVEFGLAATNKAAFDMAGCRERFRKRGLALSESRQLGFARAVTQAVVSAYWAKLCAARGVSLPLRLSPVPTSQLKDEQLDLYAEACSALEQEGAFFQIGEFYTAILPSDYRSRHGIYYTPPALVKRLLDLLEDQGVDWARARVLDPACGGAAFAAYLAQRILTANNHLRPEERLRDLAMRLKGFDLDPFAAWLSAVLVDVICLPLIRDADRRVDGIILQGDMLEQKPEELGAFDLIIGNPPYGRTTLLPPQRERFARSLYGHANLYGVFTDLAITLTRPGGLIAFVTPTSFLGGQYFKNLRLVLEKQTRLQHISFIADRSDVFSSVLQETMLAVFRRARPSRIRTRHASRARVEQVWIERANKVAVESLAKVRLMGEAGTPWLLPRSHEQVSLVRQLGVMPARLADYGYQVATGQLVWNRHKDQFRDQIGGKSYPVLWAESVMSDGSFVFRAESRNHRPYLRVYADQEYLLNFEPCVLVQRTTSKEQARRLIAAIVPNEFITAQPGYIVENHLNRVMAVMPRAVPLWVVAALLNSRPVDQAFRCISGSVAVSAYELESLPLPEPGELLARLRVARVTGANARFDEIVAHIYDRKH